jgi:hypothetical protein
MAGQYHIDLEQFSLARLRAIVESGDLLPSRRILAEQVSERFAILESMGISNLQEIINALSTKKKVARFAEESGLPGDYLTILRRQANSYVPGPVYFKDIPGLKPDHVERLASAGIKQTKQLFERAKTRAERESLSEQTGIPANALLELIQLTDLARAGWVGPVFARILYETGVDTVSKLADQRPEELFEKALAVNDEQQLTRASFTLKDIESCIETAKSLPKVVEY